jgi:hypothetical protein
MTQVVSGSLGTIQGNEEAAAAAAKAEVDVWLADRKTAV